MEEKKETDGSEPAGEWDIASESSKGDTVVLQWWLINQSVGKWWHTDTKIICEGQLEGQITAK